MNSKQKKYDRLYLQLKELLTVTDCFSSRLATIIAVLHHKMKNFYWTGAYMLVDGELLVHAYQGPLACQKLEKNVGVCWAAVNRKEPVIVENVHQFEGHIACSAATNSEIVVPLFVKGKLVGCFDIDSKEFANFDEDDAKGITDILTLLN